MPVAQIDTESSSRPVILTGYKQKKQGQEHFQNGLSAQKDQLYGQNQNNGHNNMDEPDRSSNIYTNGHGKHQMNGNGFQHPLIEEKAHVLANGTSLKVADPEIIYDNKDPSVAWKYNGVKYDKGPDQILPSTALRTWYPDGATKLRMEDSDHEIGRNAPISVPSLLMKAATLGPETTALAIKRNGEWQKWTYKHYLSDVRTVAKGFIALGLERFHSVCILGFNTPEWFISDIGAIFAGGFAAGIYTTNTPEACAYCAIDSKANIFVVEDEKQLAKVLAIRDQLPNLKAIVQYTGEPTTEGVIGWTQLLLIGSQQSDEILEERLRQISINQCCTLIYTSGTTGNPKGVMLTHDNLTWLGHVNANHCKFRMMDEEYISFLPLSHVAAQMADIYCPMVCCGSVFFGDKDALKGSLLETMKEVRPTKFLAVPRVWEKMYEKMMDIGRSTKGLKKMIATWAKAKGLEYNMKRMNGESDPESIGFKIANKIILSKVKEALGLNRCDLFLSGAAPISHEILKYFWSLNIVITEAYGMSECTGPHCMAIETAFRLGSVGRTMPGCITKIGGPDKDGCGEILMGGRNVSMGYLLQEEKTKKAIDDEGWLHSEDIGKIDEDGFVFITGRIKEILITAGGENVSPVQIEDAVKAELEIISQAVLIGDRKKFLSILLTLKTDVDKDTQEPQDTLLPVCKNWFKNNGDCSVNTVQDALNQINTNEKIKKAIQEGINKANLKAISQAQRVQKWTFLPTDFSIPGGELGPTLKLKRNVVYDRYESTIDELYK